MIIENSLIAEFKETMIQNNLFERFNLKRAGIFGSAARGEQANDLDVLIEDDVNYHVLSELRDELQKLMGKRIDIVLARYANPIVLLRAKKEIVYVTKH